MSQRPQLSLSLLFLIPGWGVCAFFRSDKASLPISLSPFSFPFLSSGVPTPSLGIVLRGGRGVRGSSPRNFFHLRWLNPLKLNYQAARFMPTVEYICKQNQRYDSVQSTFGPQTIHHTFILRGDTVGVMTIIFKQHSADGEGLAEKQGVLSTVLQGGSSEEEITSTAGPSRKEPPPLRR